MVTLQCLEINALKATLKPVRGRSWWVKYPASLILSGTIRRHVLCRISSAIWDLVALGKQSLREIYLVFFPSLSQLAHFLIENRKLGIISLELNPNPCLWGLSFGTIQAKTLGNYVSIYCTKLPKQFIELIQVKYLEERRGCSLWMLASSIIT